MTTASNSINTDSIETIAGTTTLTIGGVATSVSLKDTATQALTVTGRTTSEIQANSVEMTYTSFPGQVANQRGYQLFLASVSPLVNSPTQSGVIVTVTSNNTGVIPMTIALPIGVWSVSYTIRFRPTNAVSSVNTIYLMTTLTLDTPVVYNGITYPKYLGLQANPFPLTAPLESENRRLSMSGNTIITNNVANTLRLQFQANGQTVDVNNRINPFFGIQGSTVSGVLQTFMVATRIA
jgi:hypothetical protein